MAESNKKGMISGLDSLLSISGEEFLEVIRLEADGSFKNYRLLVSKIRNNAGLSAYEIALQNGFVGTVDEWLASLHGKSAYEIAVELGFVGDEAAFIASLKGDKGDTGKSIYQIAIDGGFVGTEADFLKTLIGKSAYQSALDEGFVGTEAEWLASLKGKDGTNGTDGVDGVDGEDGKSAFETWQELPGNAGKPESEFIASIKGVDGTDGTDGESAYEIAKALDPSIGTEAQWVASLKGDSAYQIAVDEGFVGNESAWLASLNGADGTDGEDGKQGASAFEAFKSIPGNENKTEADFILAITGEDGVDGTDGKSAYQVWQGLPGNAGKTEAEFIVAITGPKGLDGTNGTNGKDAYQVAVDQGFIGSKDQWLESLVGDTGNDGTDGVDGANGKSINVVDNISQEDFDAIVAAGTAEIADAYIVDTFIYVFNGTDWVKSNSIQGPKGTGLVYLGLWPDATPLPLDPNYKPGDTYVWKKSLWTLVESPTRGWVDIGVPGPQGKSAYETWVGLPGNAGKTEAEFIVAITGPKGADGTDGVDGVGIEGASAYEIWLEQAGNEGKSEADFIASLKGEQGEQGEAAVAFTIKAKLTDISQLPAVGDPTEAYYVNRDLYVWIVDDVTPANSKFENFGSLNGASAYETWLELPGNAGKTEEEFITSLEGTDGVDGVDGKDGRNLEILGAKADEAAVRATVDPADQDAYTTLDNGHLWIFVKTAWVDAGPFRGTNGTNGTNGKSAYQVAVDGGFVGNEAAWLASLKGTNGTNGRNVTVKGSQANLAAIQALPTPAQQDAWTSLADSHLYMYIGTAWVDLGQFKGDKGDTGDDGGIGPRGQGINILGEVELDADLPAPGTQAVGDAWFSRESRKLFQVNDALVYNPGIDITGPDGEQGIQGLKGDPGTSIKIMGSYASAAALIAAHPTGVAGEGYLVGNDLYLYGVNPTGGATEWYNAGPVRGPIGLDGPQGKPGLKGNTGGKGDRGSVWISLPSETAPTSANGVDGDWAVTPSFVTYYRGVGGVWVEIGRLVAGDVNSPSGTLGKVVRQGTEWVKLPVDEVPNLATGKVYARQSKGGSATEGEWVEIVFPNSFPEVTADNKIYGRQKADAQTAGKWTEIVIPASIPEVNGDNKLYGRRKLNAGTAAAWVEIVLPAAGIGEAPTTAGKTYVRSGETASWIEYVAGIAAPVDATNTKKFVRTQNAWVEFNQYDVAYATVTGNAVAFNAATTQLVEMDNTGATAKVVTFSNLPGAGRSTTLVLVVNGSGGTLSFMNGATAITPTWNGGAPPTFQAGVNVVTFLVLGGTTPRLIASVGAQTAT